MKAKILPLEGKYYGTIVEITYKGYKYQIELWGDADFEPSERELAKWGGKDDFEICDSHFESKITYELAKLLVNLINQQRDDEIC